MSRKFRPALAIKLADADAETARRSTNERIDELQLVPFLEIIGESVLFADGTEVTIRHQLGRAPTMVIVSPVRGATTSGRIVESTTYASGLPIDRSKYIVLVASGFGATVRAEVAVLP